MCLPARSRKFAVVPIQAEDENVVLPSDARYRSDLVALKSGDVDKAQKEKERLEELQRRDRRLREGKSPKAASAHVESSANNAVKTEDDD